MLSVAGSESCLKWAQTAATFRGSDQQWQLQCWPSEEWRKRIQRPDIKTPKNNKGNAVIAIKSKNKTVWNIQTTDTCLTTKSKFQEKLSLQTISLPHPICLLIFQFIHAFLHSKFTQNSPCSFLLTYKPHIKTTEKTFSCGMFQHIWGEKARVKRKTCLLPNSLTSGAIQNGVPTEVLRRCRVLLSCADTPREERGDGFLH